MIPVGADLGVSGWMRLGVPLCGSLWQIRVKVAGTYQVDTAACLRS